MEQADANAKQSDAESTNPDEYRPNQNNDKRNPGGYRPNHVNDNPTDFGHRKRDCFGFPATLMTPVVSTTHVVSLVPFQPLDAICWILSTRTKLFIPVMLFRLFPRCISLSLPFRAFFLLLLVRCFLFFLLVLIRLYPFLIPVRSSLLITRLFDFSPAHGQRKIANKTKRPQQQLEYCYLPTKEIQNNKGRQKGNILKCNDERPIENIDFRHVANTFLPISKPVTNQVKHIIYSQPLVDQL